MVRTYRRSALCAKLQIHFSPARPARSLDAASLCRFTRMQLHHKSTCYITAHPHLLSRGVFCESSKRPNVKMPKSAFTIASYCRARCLRASVGLFTASVMVPCAARQHRQNSKTPPALKSDKNTTACKRCQGRPNAPFFYLFAGNFELGFVKKVDSDSRRLIGIQVP